MYKMAMDLGYGFVKGVNEKGQRVCFPSVVGPAANLKMRKLLSGNTEMEEYCVNVNGTEYFVGELAAEESTTASYAFDENKISHPHTKILLATAAALLLEDEKSPVQLATGLPLQYFFKQQKEFSAFLMDYKAEVSITGSQPKLVSFDKVTLFPQGAGAIMEASLKSGEEIKKGGLFGLVDIGFRTTDYVVYEAAETFRPKVALSGTIEVGMNDLRKSVSAYFADRAGANLDILDIEGAIQKETVFYAGRDYDFRDVLRESRKQIAGAILDRLKDAWGQKANFLRILYLAGGGAFELEGYFSGFHADLRVLPDAQFGNVNGFLRVIGGTPVRKTPDIKNVIPIQKGM